MIDLRLPARARARPDDPDPEAVRLVQESRRRLISRMSGRDRWASFVMAGTFLGAAIPFALLHSSHRSPNTVTVLLLVAAYAIASRVEFEVGACSVVPTELVLVPMLFLIPTGAVPLCVAAAAVLGQLPEYARRQAHLEHAAVRLASSWHAIGPALVLAMAGERGPSLSDWDLYVAALAAQFAFDFAGVTIRNWLALDVSLRAEAKSMAEAFGVDTALAPIGLLGAIAAQGNAPYFLLVFPLVALLARFAQQRRSAFDSASERGDAYQEVAEMLMDLVEDTDAYTGDHSKQVVDLVRKVARELRVDARVQRDAELTALLHDVGKMRVPRELIAKPAGLTPSERAVMETHTVEGWKILTRDGRSDRGLLREVGNIVLSCHERWDGGGYPDGLAGDQIPLVARIVACCDAYNAMTTDRPYRRALRVQDALAEVRLHAGSQFDPVVVDALVRVLERAPALVA